ncbi:MAG: hypothetical protein FJ267_01975 [Planctomycetes bacterium]|nr:hypothetical protein [Planctomycetota bacterium]
MQRSVFEWSLFFNPGNRLFDVLSTTSLVVVCIAILVWFVYRIQAWFHEDSGRAEDGLEMLTQFRDLQRQGELTDEEYRLIKSQVIALNEAKTSKIPPLRQQAKPAAAGDLTNECDESNTTNDPESRSGEKPPTSLLPKESKDMERASGDDAPSDCAKVGSIDEPRGK